jgi:hypothetical protein
LSEGASHGVSKLAHTFLPRLSGFFLKNRNARYLFRVGMLKNHSATVKEEKLEFAGMAVPRLAAEQRRGIRLYSFAKPDQAALLK